MAKIIHKDICTEYGITVHKQYWRHDPQSVIDTEDIKLLWDFEIQTDRRIVAKRPDIFLVEKHKRRATLIDIDVPEDRNKTSKEREKIDKYQDLRLEVKRQ